MYMYSQDVAELPPGADVSFFRVRAQCVRELNAVPHSLASLRAREPDSESARESAGQSLRDPRVRRPEPESEIQREETDWPKRPMGAAAAGWCHRDAPALGQWTLIAASGCLPRVRDCLSPSGCNKHRRWSAMRDAVSTWRIGDWGEDWGIARRWSTATTRLVRVTSRNSGWSI